MWISLCSYRAEGVHKVSVFQTYPLLIHHQRKVIPTYPQCYARTYPQKLVLRDRKKC